MTAAEAERLVAQIATEAAPIIEAKVIPTRNRGTKKNAVAVFHRTLQRRIVIGLVSDWEAVKWAWEIVG